MRSAAESAGHYGPRARPAGRAASAIAGALCAATALAVLEFAPAWARDLGWAPRADFSARFALLPTHADPGCPATVLRAGVAAAVLWTGWTLRRAPAAKTLAQLAAGLLLLRAALAWWLPWRSGAAQLDGADWLVEPAPLGAPAPLGWFAWIGLIAVWAPDERGGGWGGIVALLAGAWAWWACGLADLGGCLIVAVLAAPLWLGYRTPSE
ncbi:MAG: hypothetical protein ACYS26_17015 [Planctomycetota bacterium]